MLGRDLAGACRRGYVEQGAGGRRKYRAIAAMYVTHQLRTRSVATDPDAIPAIIQRCLRDVFQASYRPCSRRTLTVGSPARTIAARRAHRLPFAGQPPSAPAPRDAAGRDIAPCGSVRPPRAPARPHRATAP